MNPEYFETDPAFHADVVQRELLDNERASRLSRLEKSVDDFFERIEYVDNFQQLIKRDTHNEVLRGVLGCDSDEELQTFMKSVEPREKAPLESLIPHAERERVLTDAGLAKGYKFLAKSYQHAAGPTEAMRSAYDLFAEYCSPETRNLIEKAIKALDIPVFLRLLSGAMQRAA